MKETINHQASPGTGLEQKLINLYGNNEQVIKEQLKRYAALAEGFRRHFYADASGSADESALNYSFYSTSGRIEIGGNHTDHNNGRVLAAGINLDTIAAAAGNSSTTIVLYSEGYDKPFIADISVLESQKSESGKTGALIRGVAARLKERGYSIGGFDAYVSSNVLPGSGLSSSASIEVLIGTIFNNLYNDNAIPLLTLAQAGQYAENHYFGKPCGLMDQVACAFGGIIAIDFKNPENPVIDRIETDFNKFGYSIVVVNTGKSHCDLTDEYKAITDEMRKIASFFRMDHLRGLTADDITGNWHSLKELAGDRAILRALHFINENGRVPKQVDALQKKDIKQFLALVSASGASSLQWLQNAYTAGFPEDQPIPLCLALTQDFIEKTGEGACRVHGGGFGGTILTLLPEKNLGDYVSLIKRTFGEDALKVLSIRATHTCRV